MIAAALQFAKDDAAQELRQKFDLALLVKEICQGENISCNTPQSLPFVGRPFGLNRLVGNLVSNAKRYGQNTDIKLYEKVGTVLFCVQDDGPSLPDDMLVHVFDPFVRGEGSRFKTWGARTWALPPLEPLFRSMVVTWN